MFSDALLRLPSLTVHRVVRPHSQGPAVQVQVSKLFLTPDEDTK
jgi:hypothetical protein